VLRSPASVVAKEYACEKLALIGGPDSTAALAELLLNASLAHAATNALQVMPCAEAGAALRTSLSKLTGLPLAGALTALGMRRDTADVEAIAKYLGDSSRAVASAAAFALGEIGSAAAASALREFLTKTPADVKAAAADAALVGAERLKSAGNSDAAKALLKALLATEPSAHVRAAAIRLNA
jgi:HEAT repeat protein